MGCHFLLQEIFLIQGSNPCPLHLLHWYADSLPSHYLGSPNQIVCMYAKSLQLCPTLCDPMDHRLPGSSVHGILQARILEWIAMASSKGAFWPTAGGFFTTMSPGKPQSDSSYCLSFLHNSFHKTDLLLLQNVKAFYVSYAFILKWLWTF